MQPKFISDITVRLIQSCGNDAMIVAAAKVSTSGEEALKFAQVKATEGNYGLIKYLMKQRHSSPFEHNCFTFFVHVPSFVLQQWQRHRTASYNQESGRYKELEPVFWIPREDRPLRPVKDFKPSRPQFEQVDEDTMLEVGAELESAYIEAWDTYQRLLKLNIATEVARSVLPIGIYSSCWVTTNLRNLFHFLSLRTHDPKAFFVSYPQAEIEEAARQIEDIVKEKFPLAYRAFCEAGRTL